MIYNVMDPIGKAYCTGALHKQKFARHSDTDPELQSGFQNKGSEKRGDPGWHP